MTVERGWAARRVAHPLPAHRTGRGSPRLEPGGARSAHRPWSVGDLVAQTARGAGGAGGFGMTGHGVHLTDPGCVGCGGGNRSEGR